MLIGGRYRGIMKKNMIKRCFLGGLIVLSISYLFSIFISAMINKGEFYTVVPQFARIFGSELNAVIVQAVCSFIYGVVIAGSKEIWEIDRWSLLKQTVIHCLIISFATFPIVFFMFWIPHSFWGIVAYIVLFSVMYFLIWLGKYYVIKKQIHAINDKVIANFTNN